LRDRQGEKKKLTDCSLFFDICYILLSMLPIGKKKYKFSLLLSAQKKTRDVFVPTLSVIQSGEEIIRKKFAFRLFRAGIFLVYFLLIFPS